MTAQRKRNRLVAAVLLALVATGALCVFGAAAMGMQLTTPFFTISFGGFEVATVGGGGGGNGGGGGGNGGGGGGNGGGGGGDGNDGGGGDSSSASGNCLLDLVCLNADVNTSNITGGEDTSLDADEDGVSVNEPDGLLDGLLDGLGSGD